MTVETTISRAGPYAGAGTVGPFPVPFRFLENSHLRLLKANVATGAVATLVLDTDYTVTGAGNETGAVTLANILAAGYTLTVLRNVPATQEADYVENDQFPAESHEAALDKLTMLVQQQGEVQARALVVPATDPVASRDLPSAAARARRYLSFNELGEPVATTFDIDAISQASQAAIVAAARAAGLRADAKTAAAIAVERAEFVKNTVDGVTPTVARFSGTGAQTVYTLPSFPGAEENTDVFISGVYQQKDTYSVDGHKLTFNAAPPVGTNNIEVNIAPNVALAIDDATGIRIDDNGTIRSLDFYVKKTRADVDALNPDNVVAPPASLIGSETWTVRKAGAWVRAQLSEVAAFILTVFAIAWTSGAGAAARTLYAKLMDLPLSIKDFGAKGDEITDDSPAVIRAAAAAKILNMAVRAPSGRYRLASPVVIDFPIVLHGDGGFGYSNTTPSSASTKHQGTVFVSEVTTDYAIKIQPSRFSFGCSLSGFSLVGKEGANARDGLYVHNIGWTGAATDITIDNFTGNNLGIGYIQDFHFTRVSLLRGGRTAASPLLKITSNSNYVYFSHCHIEDANYLALSIGGAWEVYFDHCHFESGNYNGALGPAYEHRYSSAPFLFAGNEYRWNFNACTFVPVGVDALVAANGGTRASQPYFIDGAASKIGFTDCRWIAPTTAINAVRIAGAYGRNKVVGCSFENLNPARPSVVFDDCTVDDTVFGLYEGFNIAQLDGVVINRGQIANSTFANNPGGTAKTAGYLVYSSVDGGLKLYGNRYDLGTAPFKWCNTLCELSHGDGSPGWKVYSASGAIDMETVPPGYGLRAGAGGLTLTNITNCQRGRKLKIFNDTGSGTVNFNAGQVYPATANNLNMSGFSQYVFEADATGMLIQVA